MIKETRNTSRLEILNHVIQFCTIKCFGDNSFSMGMKDNSFHGTYLDKQEPPIGSLCILQSAPTTKYYLGWLKEIKPADSRFSVQYLLESIEDGDLSWWSNVGIFHMPLETTNKYPEWHWTDKQWEFKKRWWNTCYKKCDAYLIRPLFPEFNEDGSVVLKFRKMWSNDIFTERKFDNWKKVTVKEILEFYDYSAKKNDEVKTKSQIKA